MFSQLTPRQRQVVELVAQGNRGPEIGRILGLKEAVIRNYCRAIFDKVGCDSRLQLAVLYREQHPVLFPPIPRCGECIFKADPCFWCILAYRAGRIQ